MTANERVDARTLAPQLLPSPPQPGEWMAYFAHHSRSFRFAARFMPRAERERLARVYAYCRYTDDLVDQAGGASLDVVEARLDHWLELSRRAYAGCATGVPLLDAVMRDMRADGVPFTYAAELIEGMRMDLHHEPFATQEALRLYTYRVAGVIGRWLTELFGVDDPAVLARAESLGHALQLTNIMRDVGEDFARGRVYLPRDVMAAHGVDDAMLEALCTGRRAMTDAFRALAETVLGSAEEQYDEAIAAIPRLPVFFARPVGVAAYVYRGIHDEIRRSDYDTVRRRVHTSLRRKVWLGARGLSATADRRAAPSPSRTRYAPRYGSA